MDISFVIPALNESSYIEETLRRLARFRERSHLDVEIIVVDGRSTDRTVAIAREYADQVLREPPSYGTIARARNIGGFAAQGRVIVHMDADSRIPFIDELAVHALADVDDGAWVAAVPELRPYPWDRTLTDALMHRAMNCLVAICLPLGGWFAKGECQIMARNSFNEVSGYDERLVVGEDCDMFRRLGKVGRIVFLREYAVFHSPRRFRALGYLRVFAMYAREALWLALFKANYVGHWGEVR